MSSPTVICSGITHSFVSIICNADQPGSRMGNGLHLYCGDYSTLAIVVATTSRRVAARVTGGYKLLDITLSSHF